MQDSHTLKIIAINSNMIITIVSRNKKSYLLISQSIAVSPLAGLVQLLRSPAQFE